MACPDRGWWPQPLSRWYFDDPRDAARAYNEAAVKHLRRVCMSQSGLKRTVCCVFALLVTVAGCEVDRTWERRPRRNGRPSTSQWPCDRAIGRHSGPRFVRPCHDDLALPLAVPTQHGRLLAADLRRRRVPRRPGREVRPGGNPLRLRDQMATCASWSGRVARGAAAASR